MRIVSVRTNNGPSVFHARPTLVMTLDLENYADTASTDVPHFTPELIKNFPGLGEHTCSLGYKGGFLERLQRGTYMAHITEHVAIELGNLCGQDVSFGKTRYAGRKGLYEVVVRFKNEEGMKKCLREAAEIVQDIIENKTFDLQAIVKAIKEITVETSLGPSGQALLDAARRKNIPARRIGANSLIQLGYGKNIKRVQAAVTDKTNLIAVELAQDKFLTKKLLSDNFLPVPEGYIVSNVEELNECLEKISPPYVVKPVDGNHGNGVSLNLHEQSEVHEAYKVAQSYSHKVLVEEMCEGRDYRVLVVNGKLVAAAERKPPGIVGDGVSSISKLIEVLNADPRRGDGHQNVLSRVEPDEVMLQHLKKQGLTLESVLENGKKIVLRENANLSSGGTAADVTGLVHPEVKLMCERAARIIGLDICGLDLIHSDISKPLEAGAKIIEMNAGPGLRMHLAPSEGQPRPVADAIMDMLYPTAGSSRIPIIAVTGTNGKTTTVRMIHKILNELNQCCVGLTTTDGIWISDKKIYTGDTTGPLSSQLVLSDPQVSMAVLEVARGGLLRGGVAYDWSDVAVITNISADHIGQNGIDDLEDLLWIKSLVAERVKENGTVVLNADNELVLSIRKNTRVLRQNPKFFLFSISGLTETIQAHVDSGGSACWVAEGWIMQRHHGATEHILKITDIPITMNGLAEFQIENILATLAATTAIGADSRKAMEVLKSFLPSNENAGRFNLYKIRESYVVLDYAHNFEAMSAVGKLLNAIPGYKKTAVVGLPGDRALDLLCATAENLARSFDNFILKDDDDLRGRQAGEIAKLIGETIKKHQPEKPYKFVLKETEAIRKALDEAAPNEIIAIFYDNLKASQNLILQYDPEPVSIIPFLQKDPKKFSGKSVENKAEKNFDGSLDVHAL